MKLKAKVSFAGKVCAAAGKEFLCPDEVAEDLIGAGYAEKIDSAYPEGNEKKKPEKPKGSGKNEGKSDRPNGDLQAGKN